MKIVVNSAPIISLSLINKFYLLKELFEEIIVPDAVYNEIVHKGINRAGSNELIKATWIDIVKVENINAKELIMLELDEGEAEVIEIAKEKKIYTVLIDEFAGRQYASLLGINVIGTLGILLSCKKLGLISEIRPLIDILIKKKRYINKALYTSILHNAGE
jgi:uncharacterized protein